MRIEITVPRLGWSMEEGNLVAWLKKPGEQVRAGEPLFTLEGDKALQEVEATDDGVLEIPPDAPQPGTAVRVGALLGYLIQHRDQISRAEAPAAPVGRVKSLEAVVREAAPSLPRQATSPVSNPAAVTRRAITPRALAAATRLGIEWRELSGTGRGGRIRERDVLAATSR